MGNAPTAAHSRKNRHLVIRLAEKVVQRHHRFFCEGVLLHQDGRARREPIDFPQTVLGHIQLLRSLLERLPVYEQEPLIKNIGI